MSGNGQLAIITKDLRKTYRTRRGRQVAVAGLDLAVPAGGVHGFLGPNGSGKTTTIRMLLGLIGADAGRMELFGTQVPQQLPSVIGRVGAIVESPKFFPTISGRRNLLLLARAIGAPDKDVDRVIEQVGLGERGADAFKAYSLGMKQRLAIAATLLKDPDLLIFDEPTNGLDPAGIREVRETMRSLGHQGKTVLVSSHILAEVEQVADTVSIIARGRLLGSGKVDEILGTTGTPAIKVHVDDPARAVDVLQRAGIQARLDDPPDDTEPGETAPPRTITVEGCSQPAIITRALADQGLYLSQLKTERVDLESVFLELTQGQSLGASRGDAA